MIERTLGKGRVLTMTTPVTEFGYYADRRSWNALLGGTGLEPVPWYLLVKGVVSHLVQSDADALNCLLYTSPSPRDRTRSRMPSSA